MSLIPSPLENPTGRVIFISVTNLEAMLESMARSLHRNVESSFCGFSLCESKMIRIVLVIAMLLGTTSSLLVAPPKAEASELIELVISLSLDVFVHRMECPGCCPECEGYLFQQCRHFSVFEDQVLCLDRILTDLEGVDFPDR